MVICGTSVDPYRRRHSWHSLLFLPLPVCVSGIARARESRRTNFARSLCGRFRGRSIAYNCNTAFLPRTFGLARLFRLVSHANRRWLWLIWLPYLSVACPCNEAVRHRRWEGDPTETHDGLLVARRDQTTSVIKQQPTRRSGPCDHQIVSSPSSTFPFMTATVALSLPAILL
jgi:hypothetical protein